MVIVVDVRRGIEPDDAQLLEFAAHLKLPAIIALTKLDKLSKSERLLAVRRIKADQSLPVVGFSAVSGDGRDQLWREVLAIAHIGSGKSS
jgi:GTP-binding protein